ncbi:MAG TPA: hypothetical protein VNV86_12155, partial [Candidatus Acidoferrum sp.]|nr:hypothetical protein [Candidatus Acidoferrum sp.]
LAMSDGFLVLLLALEFENDDFRRTVPANDGGLHTAAGHEFAAVFERGFGGKFHFTADLAGQLFDAEHITGRNPVLLSACFNNRVHVFL